MHAPQKQTQTKTLKLSQKPVMLAQVSSTVENEEVIQQKEKAKIQMFLEMQTGLKELMHT